MLASVHDVTATARRRKPVNWSGASGDEAFHTGVGAASVITLKNADVQPEASLVLSATPRRPGSAVGDGDIVVALTEVSGSMARGIVADPNAYSVTGELAAYALDEQAVGPLVGAGRIVLPDRELGNSLQEASTVLGRLGEATDAMLEATQGWEQALDTYETAVDSMINLQRALERVGIGPGGD